MPHPLSPVIWDKQECWVLWWAHLVADSVMSLYYQSHTHEPSRIHCREKNQLLQYCPHTLTHTTIFTHSDTHCLSQHPITHSKLSSNTHSHTHPPTHSLTHTLTTSTRLLTHYSPTTHSTHCCAASRRQLAHMVTTFTSIWIAKLFSGQPNSSTKLLNDCKAFVSPSTAWQHSLRRGEENCNSWFIAECLSALLLCDKNW